MRVLLVIAAIAATACADLAAVTSCQQAFITSISEGCDAVAVYGTCLANAVEGMSEEDAAHAITPFDNANDAWGCGIGAGDDSGSHGQMAHEDNVAVAEVWSDETDWKSILMAYQHLVAAMDSLADDLSTEAETRLGSGIDSAQDALDAVSGPLAQRVAAAKETLQGFDSRVSSSSASLNSQTSAREALSESLSASIAERTASADDEVMQLQHALSNSQDTIQRSVRTQINQVSVEVREFATESYNRRMDAAETADGTLSDIEDALTELEDTMGYQPPVIWSGGCRHSSYGGGWDTYCFNGNDRADQFPQSAYRDYIEVTGSNRFRFRKPGFYRINWWADQHGCGSYNVDWNSTWNGGHRHVGYAHRDSKPGGWFSNSMDQTWAFKEGDRFWMTVHGGWCGPWRWHSWNESGNHSRIQVRYVGPLSDGQ